MGYTLQSSNMKSLWRHGLFLMVAVTLPWFCTPNEPDIRTAFLCRVSPDPVSFRRSLSPSYAIVGFSCSATTPCWVCAGGRSHNVTSRVCVCKCKRRSQLLRVQSHKSHIFYQQLPRRNDTVLWVNIPAQWSIWDM